GSTVALTKPDGTVAATRAYDAFGAPRAASGPPQGSFWFAGEQYDPETKLIYLRARYYDPTTGRFLQADPAAPDLTDTQSLNQYSYARNNPLRYTDPTGQTPTGDPITDLNIGLFNNVYLPVRNFVVNKVIPVV